MLRAIGAPIIPVPSTATLRTSSLIGVPVPLAAALETAG
jgi:hypothetical protein